MSDKYVTHDEIDSKFEIYDGKIKSYIFLKQSELKSDFIQYVNDIIKNNKANTALITTNMNTRMQAMETKIDIVSEKLGTAKTLVIFALIALIADLIIRII